MDKLKVLDLFSGIGGFSLGLERAGMETIAFCEIEEFPRGVLAKHWPKIPIYNDVKEICRWKWKSSKAQILLRQASHAKTYHSLERVPDLRASVLVFSGKPLEPFAWYDHPSRCWRTWQRCFIEEWALYSAPWPPAGMTRNGIAYALPMLDTVTKEIGSSSLLTPTAQGWRAWTFRKPLSLIRKNHADGNLQEQLMRLYQRMITPECVEILMGFPKSWTRLKRGEIQSVPLSPKSSDEQ